MTTLNGKEFAAQKELQLLPKVQQLLKKNVTPSVRCLVFSEDQGGVVYAQEKKSVANRLNIGYEVVQASLASSPETVKKTISDFAQDPQITGIIIQKPWRQNWELSHSGEQNPFEAFQTWWHALTTLIPLSKDIDGPNPQTLKSIRDGDWREKKLVLPATCRAVLSILDHVQEKAQIAQLSREKTIIVGRSELLGTPLYHELQHQGWSDTTLVGQKEFKTLIEGDKKLTEFKTIITSTGIFNLIKADMISPGSIIVDAGFPQGDVDFSSVSKKALFITPVPNGVGPVTVISLLENVVELCYNFSLTSVKQNH